MVIVFVTSDCRKRANTFRASKVTKSIVDQDRQFRALILGSGIAEDSAHAVYPSGVSVF